jgi:hypothetical protein
VSSKGVSIFLITTDFRGDHETDVSIAHVLREGETVQQLAERLLIDKRDGARFVDRLEIRLMQP